MIPPEYDGTAGPNLIRPTAPAINNPQPSKSAFGESAFVSYVSPPPTPEANRQAAMAGGPPVRRAKVAGDVCKPQLCGAILMNAPDGAVVCPESWRQEGGDVSDLSHAGEPLRRSRVTIEREEVVTVMGEYLFAQMRAYPEITEWLAGALVGRLVANGKKPNMPGAVRTLIDVTGAVEALVTPTPADPPSPPASPTTTGGATPRRRWWSR